MMVFGSRLQGATLHRSIKSLNKRWKEAEFCEFKWGREMQMDYLDFKALLPTKISSDRFIRS